MNDIILEHVDAVLLRWAVSVAVTMLMFLYCDRKGWIRKNARKTVGFILLLAIFGWFIFHACWYEYTHPMPEIRYESGGDYSFLFTL